MLRFIGGTVIKVWRVSGVRRRAVLLEFHKVDMLGDDAFAAARQDNAVLYRVFDIGQKPRIRAIIAVVDKNRTTFEHVHISLTDQVDGRLEERVSRCNQRGLRLSLNITEGFVETHALVAL